MSAEYVEIEKEVEGYVRFMLRWFDVEYTAVVVHTKNASTQFIVTFPCGCVRLSMCFEPLFQNQKVWTKRVVISVVQAVISQKRACEHVTRDEADMTSEDLRMLDSLLGMVTRFNCWVYINGVNAGVS